MEPIIPAEEIRRHCKQGTQSVDENDSPSDKENKPPSDENVDIAQSSDSKPEANTEEEDENEYDELESLYNDGLLSDELIAH